MRNAIVAIGGREIRTRGNRSYRSGDYSHKTFREMIRKIGGTGIALENNCAIEFIDDQFFRVISSKDYSRAYRVYKRGGDIVAEQIRQEEQLAPVECLIMRP